MKMKIEMIKLSELHPAKKNIRMHPPEQIREYKRSIRENGQTKPIVIDEENNIIIGNGLYLAMKELKESEAACLRKTGLTENQKIKLMMSDNRIFDLGSEDLSVFDDFLKELDGDFDIPGYSEDLLKSLTMGLEETTSALKEYGIVDGEKSEEIRKAEGVYEEPKTQEQLQEVYANSEQPHLETPTERNTEGNFVICPKCGEKIWL